MTFRFASRDIWAQWNVHFPHSFSTSAGIHSHPEQFWKGRHCRALSWIQKDKDMKLCVCSLVLWFGFFCGYVVTFRCVLLILYAPFFWTHFSFSYNMAQVISRIIQGLTLACKFVKARQKTRLAKSFKRDCFSIPLIWCLTFFLYWDICLNNSNEQSCQKRQLVGQISVMPFQWPLKEWQERFCMQWQPGACGTGLMAPGWSFRRPQAPCTSVWMSMRGQHFLLSFWREGCKAPGFPGHFGACGMIQGCFAAGGSCSSLFPSCSVPVEGTGAELCSLPYVLPCTALTLLFSTSVEPSSVQHREPFLLLLTGWQVSRNLPSCLSCPFSWMQEEVTRASLPLPADAQYDCIDWAGWQRPVRFTEIQENSQTELSVSWLTLWGWSHIMTKYHPG